MNLLRTCWAMGAAAAALLGALAIAQAQAEGVSIKGIVVDQSGQPVPQEPVSVDGADRSATIITNSQGEFVVFNLPSGDYEVSAAGATERVQLKGTSPWWSFGPAATPVHGPDRNQGIPDRADPRGTGKPFRGGAFSDSA
jgi:Carboxypeptidase regulatory-like domain